MSKLIDSNNVWKLIDKTITKIQNNNYVAEQKWFDELWKDFVDLSNESSKTKITKKYNEICIKENIVASYEYEHNDKDGNKIWSDIRKIYKTNDENIYIEKHKNSRTGIVTYKEKPLADVIEDIAIYNIDKEKYEYEYE